jgi:hypothetical protein
LLGYINDCKTQTINYDSASWFADQAIRIVAKTNLVQGPYFAFHKLVKEEQLDAEKLQKVIDRYVYTGTKPLPDPDIMDLIDRPLKLAERRPTKTRVLEKVVNYVATYIHGIAA